MNLTPKKPTSTVNPAEEFGPATAADIVVPPFVGFAAIIVGECYNSVYLLIRAAYLRLHTLIVIKQTIFDWP